MIMDDGEPTELSSTTRIVIKVEDVNDNAPEFDQKTYNVEIPSNAEINQKVFQVSLLGASISIFTSLSLEYFIYSQALFLTSKRALNDL